MVLQIEIEADELGGSQDLVAWLEKQERATKPLQLHSTLASPVDAYPDGGASRHQEAAEVSNLLIGQHEPLL